MREHVDKRGNRIEVEEGSGCVTLFLKTRETRKIGKLVDGVYTKYMTRKNIFRKTDSLGFNWEVIDWLKPKKVVVNLEGTWLNISGEDFFAKKEFLDYKKLGFELQCFVKLEHFKRR